jgi:ribosomal protein L24E
MKVNISKILIFVLVFIGCFSDGESSDEDMTNSAVDNDLSISKGLGKTSEIYVSNWNQLVAAISEDEQTTTFFSINPDEVKWTSLEKNTLYYEFGNLENPQNVFVINLNINKENDTVSEVEFFAPTSNDEINSQQSKLFFLIVIALSDDTLDKNDRENILNNLGLYEELSNPKQLAGSVTRNNVRYILEPLVDNNLLFGLNLYSSLVESKNN